MLNRPQSLEGGEIPFPEKEKAMIEDYRLQDYLTKSFCVP